MLGGHVRNIFATSAVAEDLPRYWAERALNIL
jgi:hypothetical protein